MYLCDIHSHTKLSPCSSAELSDTARAAIDAGLQEFCVTDHCDLLGVHGESCAQFDWPAAKELYCQGRFGRSNHSPLRAGAGFRPL